MNIVLGFGSTELETEAAEEKAIREHVESRYAGSGLDYFTDAFVKEIEAWIKARADASQAQGAVYKTAADYPARYSYFWADVLSNANNIVAIMTFHHINRRHGLSPDGWAMMRTEPAFVFKRPWESPK